MSAIRSIYPLQNIHTRYMGVTFINPYRVGPIDGDYIGSDASASDLATYTFASKSLAAASLTRKIVVTVQARIGSNTTLEVSSLTVAGFSAVRAHSHRVVDSPNCNIVEFWVAAVPTGTSGDIVVSLNATAVRLGISWFWMSNASSTPSATSSAGDAAAGTTMTLSLDTLTGGIVFAASFWTSGATAATWNGLTEVNDAAAPSSEPGRFGSAWSKVVTGEAPRAITCVPAASILQRISAAVCFGQP